MDTKIIGKTLIWFWLVAVVMMDHGEGKWSSSHENNLACEKFPKGQRSLNSFQWGKSSSQIQFPYLLPTFHLGPKNRGIPGIPQATITPITLGFWLWIAFADSYCWVLHCVVFQYIPKVGCSICWFQYIPRFASIVGQIPVFADFIYHHISL